jgi:hypothetical protein
VRPRTTLLGERGRGRQTRCIAFGNPRSPCEEARRQASITELVCQDSLGGLRDPRSAPNSPLPPSEPAPISSRDSAPPAPWRHSGAAPSTPWQVLPRPFSSSLDRWNSTRGSSAGSRHTARPHMEVRGRVFGLSATTCSRGLQIEAVARRSRRDSFPETRGNHLSDWLLPCLYAWIGRIVPRNRAGDLLLHVELLLARGIQPTHKATDSRLRGPLPTTFRQRQLLRSYPPSSLPRHHRPQSTTHRDGKASQPSCPCAQPSAIYHAQPRTASSPHSPTLSTPCFTCHTVFPSPSAIRPGTYNCHLPSSPAEKSKAFLTPRPK